MWSDQKIAEQVHEAAEEMSGVHAQMQQFVERFENLMRMADDNSEDDSSFFAMVEDIHSQVEQAASQIELAVAAAEGVKAA